MGSIFLYSDSLPGSHTFFGIVRKIYEERRLTKIMQTKNEAKDQGELPEIGFIRDKDCTKDTPVILGIEDIPIYGTGNGSGPGSPGERTQNI